MPTPTTRLRAVLQDPGSNLNVWGQLLNDQAISLLDEAIAGVEKISLTGNNGSLSLTSANYASDQARNAALIFQGTPSVDVTVTIPSVEKVYTCVNQTAKAVTLTAGGTTVTLAAGEKTVVWCDGTDCGFGAMSVGVVNGLIANAQLAGANLPGQGGNAGKYLQTDGSVPQWASPLPMQTGNAGKFLQTSGTTTSWATIDPAGGADATITTATTLTASSSVVQSVNMAADALSVTLPAATSLTKGGRKFVVLNIGNRPHGIRDNAGTLLTVVPSGGAAEMHLRDNSTAAGSWGVTGRGLEMAMPILEHTAPATITKVSEPIVKMTDTLSLHFGETATGFSAVVVDSTSGAASVGTWTVVEALAAAVVYYAFKISDTQAIVFWVSSGNYRACTLTIDPATKGISVASATTGTAGFFPNVAFATQPRVVQLTPTLYLAASGSGTAINATAVSVSGTAVTIGTQTANIRFNTVSVTNGYPIGLFRLSDTTALVIYYDDTGTTGTPFSIRASVLSVSGTTVTAGTAAGINDTVAAPASIASIIPSLQLSASKFVVAWADATVNTQTRAMVFTVSGTAVSVGSALVVESGLTANGAQIGAEFSGATKYQPNLFRLSDTTALLTYNTTSATPRYFVLTEVSGSLVATPYVVSTRSMGFGGNFPQDATGFSYLTTPYTGTPFGGGWMQAVTISGTALTFGEVEPPPPGYSFNTDGAVRFRLSNGVMGVTLSYIYSYGTGTPPVIVPVGRMALYRQRGASLVFLGFVQLNTINPYGWGTTSDYAGSTAYSYTPFEISPNRAVFSFGGTSSIPASIQILEFASA